MERAARITNPIGLARGPVTGQRRASWSAGVATISTPFTSRESPHRISSTRANPLRRRNAPAPRGTSSLKEPPRDRSDARSRWSRSTVACPTKVTRSVGSGQRAAVVERLLEGLFLVVREGTLDQPATVLGDLGHDLVTRRLLHQHDHRSPALGQLLAELLHEVVVYAVVACRTAGRTGCRADSHAEYRHEEQESDHAAPERAACRADPGERGLVQLELAVVLVLDDHRVLERE